MEFTVKFSNMNVQESYHHKFMFGFDVTITKKKHSKRKYLTVYLANEPEKL